MKYLFNRMCILHFHYYIIAFLVFFLFGGSFDEEEVL